MFSDVGPLELLTIAILGMLLFGPDKLPEFIRNTADLIARFRQFSEQAKQEIRSELGPDFQDFEFEDLHPKTLVRKHVLNGDGLGLDEIRDALDPRKELAEAVDAVRGTTGDEGGAAGGLPGGPAPTGGTPDRMPSENGSMSFTSGHVSFEKGQAPSAKDGEGGEAPTRPRAPFDAEAT
ncbi:Sec-independent protein translocase subunit TatB [Streptomyces sp. NPDC056061]|uniref:Sec-independent protein translocase subunit TatB n=1 Tax=Streptomyces sp. NPDC056061 TaxID=3345700 RepID=UPI0035E1A0CD